MELPIKEYIRKNYVLKKKLIKLRDRLDEFAYFDVIEEINDMLEGGTNEESNR